MEALCLIQRKAYFHRMLPLLLDDGRERERVLTNAWSATVGTAFSGALWRHSSIAAPSAMKSVTNANPLMVKRVAFNRLCTSSPVVWKRVRAKMSWTSLNHVAALFVRTDDGSGSELKPKSS